MPDKDVMLQIRQHEEQAAWSALDAHRDALLAALDDMPSENAEAQGLRAALMHLATGFRARAELYAAAKLKGAQTAHVIPLRNAAQQLDVIVAQLEQPRRAPLGQLQAPPPRSAVPASIANEPDRRESLEALVADAVAEGRGMVGAVLGTPAAETEYAANVAAVAVLERPAPAVAESPHPFTVHEGATGSVCTRLVLRDGSGEDCGKLPGHPVHDLRNAEPEPDAAELAAYLRGESNALPESLQHGGPAATADITIDPTVGPDFTGGEFTAAVLTDPREITARDNLEHATVTSTIPPMPMLGQPGDMGSGYSPTYVPPGSVPMTYAELLTPIPVAALPAHISYSQMDTVGECAAKYRLTRIGRNDGHDVGAPVDEIPQWSLIGGQALHAVIEDMERGAAQHGAGVLDAVPPETLWTQHFDAEITKVEASSPVPRSRWRASKQGKENEAWWRAEGPRMVANYLAARPAEPTAQMPDLAAPGVPLVEAIEHEISVQVPTPYGPIAYRAILDRVTVRMHPDEQNFPGPLHPRTLIIRDYKSGDKLPMDVSQLGEYAQALRLAGVPASVRILGTFFDARKGTWTPEVDLEAAGYTPEWFTYKVTSGHAQRLALTQGPTPARPSSFCGGCPVRYACPLQGVGAPKQGTR